MTQQRTDCSPTVKIGSPKQIVGLQASKLGEQEQLSVGKCTRPFVFARYVPDGFRMGLTHAPCPP
jgi:hypothetical protein